MTTHSWNKKLKPLLSNQIVQSEISEFCYINFFNADVGAHQIYRGLYRGILGDWDINGNSKLSVFEFINLGIEGRNIPFSEKNLELAIIVDQIFKVNNFKPEFTVISNTDFSDSRFEFLGYDICANSLYYSPIGSGGITGEDAYLLDHMDSDLTKDVLSDLNSNGLLSTLEIAKRFAEFCTINAELIESETPWTPVSVSVYLK
jgi:hypothetical protein